jgi:hypothetical protein
MGDVRPRWKSRGRKVARVRKAEMHMALKNGRTSRCEGYEVEEYLGVSIVLALVKEIMVSEPRGIIRWICFF